MPCLLAHHQALRVSLAGTSCTQETEVEACDVSGLPKSLPMPGEKCKSSRGLIAKGIIVAPQAILEQPEKKPSGVSDRQGTSETLLVLVQIGNQIFELY